MRVVCEKGLYFMNGIRGKEQRKRDILFIIGLIVGFFFLLWKSRFGTGAYDEPFYLTIPHRIVSGDGMFSEEWNFGQFSSFLLLPVMKLYLLVAGTTEGILLHFRYIYIGFQLLCAVAVYLRLRKSELSWCAAWLFLLFCPYDIMAVSYNTMGLAFMTLAGVLLVTAKEKDKKIWVFTGLFFAAAVLCNPFLVLLYAVYSLLVLTAVLKKKAEKKAEGKMAETECAGVLQDENFSVSAWLMITAGAAALAVLFVITVLAGSGIGELLENIPLLMDDPEHTSRSLYMIVKVYVLSFWNIYGWALPEWALLLLVSYVVRKDSRKRKICFALTSLSVVLSLLDFIPTIQNSYNFIMVPIAVCGLSAYIMTKEKDKRTFYFLYVFGLAYTFLANYASNQGMHAIAMAMIPTDVAAVLFIGKFAAQELGAKASGGSIEAMQKDEGKSAGGLRWLLCGSVILLFVTQLGMQIYTKTVHTFWEEPIWKLDTVVTAGPLKGTVTTGEKAEEYEKMLTDISLHIEKNGPVLFAVKDTWCYLYADAEYGTFSSYLSGGLEQASERWEIYYDAHPEKIPGYIYVPKDGEEAWETSIFEAAETAGYRVEESELAYHLYNKEMSK